MRSFEIESFNPQLLKEREREGEGWRFWGRVSEGRKDKGYKERQRYSAGEGAQSSGLDWVYVYFNA